VVGEARHLDGVKGNLAIADDKIYAATAIVNVKGSVGQLVISNAKILVEQLP